MTYFWIIAIFIFLIFAALERGLLGSWLREGWSYLTPNPYKHDPGDVEIRAFYRRRACEHVPAVGPDDQVLFPDPILDKLIYEERFDEANAYRMRQLQQARERHDAEGVKNYVIYKALITKRRVTADEYNRQNLRSKFPKIQKAKKELPADDPTEIIGKRKKKRRKRIRSGYLEISSDLLPKNRPPISLQDTPEPDSEN